VRPHGTDDNPDLSSASWPTAIVYISNHVPTLEIPVSWNKSNTSYLSADESIPYLTHSFHSTAHYSLLKGIQSSGFDLQNDIGIHQILCRSTDNKFPTAQPRHQAPETRHVHGNGETGFYRPTDLLVKPYTNLAVTVPNHPFFKKTGIFK
jgi:hypothetical protein